MTICTTGDPMIAYRQEASVFNIKIAVEFHLRAAFLSVVATYLYTMIPWVPHFPHVDFETCEMTEEDARLPIS